ncbi:hypothetical protein GA0074692_2703 [Micromonospora pallida]|uniref:Uncharacterized protein n=2 Tax=Micromonospora pallida TaxID=145854 RepID=A0A1C6SIE1_9ACTN|nr:hypothetical protein GA0074692_2703 [Micromonospora pallida]
MIAVHFGKVDEAGTGFAEVSYTAADGTEIYSRREIGRSLNDSQLAKLRSKAADKVWDLDRPPLVRDFSITTPVHRSGELSVGLGRAERGRDVLGVRIPSAPVVGGLPPVLTRELEEARLLLGYARDGGRPTAVVEAPAGKNVKGLPLYLELSKPVITRYDIERLRKRALWEPEDRWALSEQVSFDVVLQPGASRPGSLSIRAALGRLSIEVSGSGRARTLAGAEVDLSPGTSVTLSVGKWPGQGEDGAGVAGTIPVVVRAPLVDGPGHVYRLFDTGVDIRYFDDLTREISTASAEVREVPERIGVQAVGGSGGVPRGWKRSVASAIAQLSAVGTRGEAGGVRDVAAEFAQWTRDVLGIDLLAHVPKLNDFHDAVVRRFKEKLKAAGVDPSISGLRAWVARELAADLRRGGESEFSRLLPYPEVMSEQRREDLHRQWINKIANVRTADDDVAHVVPRVIASRLSLSMRIHHSFGAPHDIGPEPRAGVIRHPIVFHKGAYHLGQLPDPADVERTRRIAEGFPRTEISDDEQRRLDRLFVHARDLLRAAIAEAENNPHPTDSKHWPVLRETLQRELAVIREHPDSPHNIREHPDSPHNRKARELAAYRLYFDDLRADHRWEEETTGFRYDFTLDVGVTRRKNSKSMELSVPLDGGAVPVSIGRLAIRGDRLPVHFGARGEEGIAFAEFRYTDATDGTDRILYLKFEHNLSDGDLLELRGKAAGRVWDLHHLPLSSDHYQVAVPLLGRQYLAGQYGDPAAGPNDRRIAVPHVPVVGGLPAVLYADLNGRLILGYAEDGRPTAVLVAPAEKNVTGLPLYLEVGKPALVVDDIKRLRKDALWEPEDRWALSEQMSFEVVLEQGKWTPGPLPIAVGGPDPARTLAGAEVDLSPGTSVTLSVGQWPGRVGADVAGTIPVVVRAPLVDGSGHVYRLLDTGVDNERFDDLKRDITEALKNPGSTAAMLAGRSDDAAQGLPQEDLETSGWLPAAVATAIEQLSAAGNLDEQNFVRWTGEVFGIDLTRAKPGNFYDSVFRTFKEQFAALGINRQRLHEWTASSLAADLRLGDASEFRRLLPYPEGVSEQRREDLHRQWIGKIAYGYNSDHDVAHVAVHVLARLIPQSVRIYQPFDAPHDIGSGSDSTKLPVVFYRGAYYLGRPADPNDADLAARIAMGPERTPIPDGEKRRLDGLFDQALGMLLARIGAVEEKLRTAGSHWSVQREHLQRRLAVIRQGVGGVDLAERQRPKSPRQQADILAEYRRYLHSMFQSSPWRGEDPRPQGGRVTLHLNVASQGDSMAVAFAQVGDKRLRIRHLNAVAIPGDRIAVDFGMDGEKVFAVARIPYTAPDGTERFIYRDFDTDFTAEDLNALNERAVEAPWRKVHSAIEQLTARKTHKGSAFKRWAYEVFRIGRAEGGARPLDAFYGTVLSTHQDRLAQAGVTTVAELGALVARHLDADLRRGGQSMFRALLPYPEDMSEQRRETLHQHLLNKLLHRQPGYPDVVHVVPHIVAWGLGLPMAIHYPYGAPYVIGPPSDDGEVPQPVVWFDGAYYLAQPRDPHDARIVEGFPSPAALTELRRLDVVFDEALEVLKTEVDTAEQNTAIGHWPLLRDTFHRNVAAISQRPSSPQVRADVLEEHLRYRDALREESTWEDENRWNLQDPFTIPVLVEDTAGRPTLRLRLDGNDISLGYADRVAVPGDRVAVDFGKVDGEGVGIARIPYTAPDGTERFVYQEIARRFTDSELAELWSVAAGPVWETVDRWTFGNSYHVTAPVSESGTFDITFGGQRVTLPPVEVADGLPPVIAAELREGRFRLGYGMDSRPLAVLEAPAGRNGTGAPLYLELSSPAPTAYDIERLRSMALWESAEPAALLDEVSIDLVMQEDRRTPYPLPLTLGDDNSGRTLDGQEVDLSPGTEVALRVGRFLRLEESNVVTSIVAVVKAPLADQSGYVYRLIDTNLPNEWFDEFKTQWETTDSGKRPAAPAWPAGPLEKRPRTGGELPGSPAAFEWGPGKGSFSAGVGVETLSSSGWAAGVEPSVEQVDGGWRVSYRSAEGLPSWGEMNRVHSDRFTWKGPAPLEFVPTPGDGRPFRVVTAGEDAGVRVHVDHWVDGESGTVVFRLRLEPDANVVEKSIVDTLGAVEQWVVQTNERLRPEGGPPAVAVVFDPAAETVVRLSRYGSDLKDSHRVWVSEDGSAGRITQLHWLADLPSRAYGHELKHFAGVPHDGSPDDLLRTSRTVGDDHLHEPGFTAWELDEIRKTAASYVARTVEPRPAPALVPLGVPRDGLDLLSAFVASEPALVRTALDARLPADLREFLSGPAGVRAAVAESVRTGVPQGSELGRVTELLRDHVSGYLEENAGRLPADVTAQRLAFQPQHERDVATLSPDQAQRRVGELLAAGLLDPDTARARLDEMRANPADAGRHLLEVLTDPDRQLDSGELAAVKAAVHDWANLSDSPAGRFLAPLLAHATDARMQISQVAPDGVRPVAGYGPAGGAPVSLARAAADPERPGVHFDALVPETPAAVEPSAVPSQQLAPAPQPPAPAAGDGQQQVVPLASASPDAPLVVMAEGLPENLRLQRAVGGVLLHDRDAAPGPISSRVLAPTGPGPAVLLHSSVLDPDSLGAALAGLRAQDATMAVLHWPQDQPVSVARALEVTAQGLGPQSSAMLSVPRSALRDRPTPSPQIVPLDANGEVTFFSGRPERYLFLPEVTGAPRRPAPYGLPEQSPGVYRLGDDWVVWDGGSHLWIGPESELDGARRLLPETGGWLAEPVVFLGWKATALPAEVGHRVGRIFGGMPAAPPTHLITSGMGLDRRTLVPSEVSGLPAGVQLSHVPGGVLAHAGPRPPAGATTLNWSDLTSPDRPRLVVDESVGDPVAVVEAVHRGLPSGAGPLQVFVAPPAAGTPGTSSGAVDAARVAEVLRERFGGRLELVLPVSVVGRQPAGADELIPVDARGQETFPAAAHAWRVPLRPAPPRQPGPLGLRPAATDGYEVYRGWTVREQTGVVLFAQNGTSPNTLSPDALAAPASGVAVVVQSRGGPIPREVADTVARLLSGVPEADRDVRVFGNAASAGPAAPDPGGSSASAPARPATPDRRALALGDPKANLPDVDRIEQGLRAEVARRGVTVRDNEWEQLRERLLNNYPQLVSADGHLFTLGGIEVRARLRPEDPQLVSNPAGSFDTETSGPSLDDTEGRTSEDGRFHANQFTQGVFQTGAHSQSDGTTTRAMRLRGDFNVDVPLGPMTHWGPRFNATLNKVDQKSAYLIDAEKGRVFDTRADSTFYSYEPGWLIEARGDAQPWQAVEVPEPPDGQEAARLVVAIPDHLLESAGEQVVADLPEHMRDNLTRVPELFSASNITGLNELYDLVIDRLRADGFDMSIESPMRGELQRKLWNLETHFDEAVNNRRTPETDGDAGALTRGFAFTLHDDGHAAASIRVYGRRLGGSVQVGLGGGSTRVGASSDKAHIEQVRTGIVGQGGEFTLGQSAGLSLGGAVDLPLARRLDDPQAYKENAKLGLSARAGMSWTSNDGGGVTVASLNVVVGRYTGQTVGHEVPFEWHAEVSTSRRPREWPHPTPVVNGSAVLRMSEPDAFDYGFSVDADAFAPDTVPGLADGDLAVVPAGGRLRSVPHDQWRPRLRNTGVHPEDTGGNLLPRHVIQGRGLLGQALPRIDKPAVRRLRAGLMEVLAGEGFLPADGDRPWAHGEQNRPATPDPGTPLEERPLLGRMVDGARDVYDEVVHRDTDATIDNLDLFHKMVSGDGLESHFDSLVQDGAAFVDDPDAPAPAAGMSFTLHSWRNAVMRTAEVTVFAIPRITADVDADGNSVHFERLSDEVSTVTLGMSLGIAGQGASGNQGWSVEGGVNTALPPSVKDVRSVGLLGGSVSRNVGAAERVTRVVNRPELKEYGGRVMFVNAPYDLGFVVRISDRDAPIVSPELIRANVHAALLKFNTDPATFSEVAPGDVAPSALHQGIVYFVDAHGLRAAAQNQLPRDLTLAGRPMTGPVASLTNHVTFQARFKEAMLGQYGATTLVEPGFWANTNAALSVKVPRIKGAQFVGATPDQYVTGLIELYLAETVNVANESFTKVFNLPNVGLSRKFGPVNVSFGESAGVRVSESESAETKRVGGLEMLKLAFGLGYAYVAEYDANVRAGIHKQVGFAASRVSVPPGADLRGRTMLFILPEAEALAQYAAGKLPVSDVQLVDAMGRWSRGELVLSGNTVAGLLSRWRGDLADRASSRTVDGLPDLGAYLIQHRVQTWALTLADRHVDQRGAVLDPRRRARFATDFGITLDPNVNPFSALTVPPYLTRTGDRTLGHAGVDDLVLFTGPAPADGGPRPTTTVLDAVRELVDAGRPGLLGASHDNWPGAGTSWGVLMVSPDESVVGALPGGLETLQSTLAGQRANIVFADMLHRYNGVTFYLVDQRNPVAAQMFKLKVSGTLGGRPRYTGWRADYGIENYEHAYGATARIIGQALGWNLTPARFGFSVDGVPVSTAGSLSFAPGGGRGVKGAAQVVRERTVYDWTGNYEAEDDIGLTMELSRVQMHGWQPSYLVNHVMTAMNSAADWALHQAPAGFADWISLAPVEPVLTRHYEGRIDFKVPRGLAEATPVPRSPQLDLRALPALPGDAYVSAALVDDLYPAARHLMGNVLGPQANAPMYRGSVALDGLLSRLNVDNHLSEGLGDGGYLLGSHLFVAGSSNNRVAMRMYVKLHSLEIISELATTGTGRYAKFAFTTSATQSRNRWRPNFDAEAAYGSPIGKTNIGPQEDTTAGGRISTGANRNAPASHSATFDDTKRLENHLKMQGLTYLVRIRTQARFVAVPHQHSAFHRDAGLAPIEPARFEADDAPGTGWMSGDGFYEMFADEVHELQRALSERYDWKTNNPAGWPAPAADAPTIGLEGLLQRATPAGMAAAPVADRVIQAGDFDPDQAPQHVALLIRDQLGNHYDPVSPLRLTASAAEQTRRRYEVTLDWAVGHLQQLNATQQATADLAELTAWKNRVGKLAVGAALSAADVRLFNERIPQIVERVQAVQPPGSPSVTPPEEVELLAQDPRPVARVVAFELKTHLDLTVTDDQGAASRYRIDPQGWIVALREGPDGTFAPVTAPEVIFDLDRDLKLRADAAGIRLRRQMALYHELLGRTPVQMDAAAELGPELETHIRQARADADDRAREWITEGLPAKPANPLAVHTARHDTDTAQTRAGQARRLLAPVLPPGWTTTGPLPLPLPQAPDTLRPGTRVWITRPQGAAAARVDADGTYRLYDPFALGTAERTLDAQQFQDVLAGASAVTLVEPDVLTSWLLQDGNWTASRQFAEDNLGMLRADPTATRLTQDQQQARPASPPTPPAQPDATRTETTPAPAGDPVRDRHRALLDAIRAGQLTAAYDYLAAADATARHRVLADAVAAVVPTAPTDPIDPTAPAGLRALADLVDADPRVTRPRPGPEAVSDAGILRAVADILDPAVGALDTFRAIASAAWTINPRRTGRTPCKP